MWTINGTATIEEVDYVLQDILAEREKPLAIVYYQAEAEEKKWVLRKEGVSRDPLVLEEEKEEDDAKKTAKSKYGSKAKSPITNPGAIKHGSKILGKKDETATSSTKSSGTRTSTVSRKVTAQDKKALKGVLNEMSAKDRNKVIKAMGGKR
jgi:hypothetical protein